MQWYHNYTKCNINDLHPKVEHLQILHLSGSFSCNLRKFVKLYLKSMKLVIPSQFISLKKNSLSILAGSAFYLKWLGHFLLNIRQGFSVNKTCDKFHRFQVQHIRKHSLFQVGWRQLLWKLVWMNSQWSKCSVCHNSKIKTIWMYFNKCNACYNHLNYDLLCLQRSEIGNSLNLDGSSSVDRDLM